MATEKVNISVGASIADWPQLFASEAEPLDYEKLYLSLHSQYMERLKERDEAIRNEEIAEQKRGDAFAAGIFAGLLSGVVLMGLVYAIIGALINL